MNPDPTAPLLARWLAGAGAVLVVVSGLLGGGGSLLLVPFILWGLVPYALIAVLPSVWPDRGAVLGAGLLALAVEAGIRGAVFVFPRGSTAAIALVFSPAWISMVALPVGGGLGWAAGKAWERGGLLGRAVVALGAPAALGLAVLGLARPDLFPTVVAARRAALERLGPPRVVAAPGFERVRLTDKAAWYMAYADAEGERLIEAGYHGVVFRDAATFAETGRLAFPEELGRRWNWFSRLVRVGGEPKVAQTGGGFSATELLSLDGSRLWEYRPNPKLAPDALRPADLDGDGAAEFYASDMSSVVRLDALGREVWKQGIASGAGLLVSERIRAGGGWVVSVSYPAAVKVWDPQGRLLGEPALGAAPVAVVDWGPGALVTAQDGARLSDLKGTELLSYPLPDLRLAEAVAFRTEAGREHLALSAVGDRDLGRARLVILGPDGKPVYDEVLEKPLRLFKVRRGAGDVLFASGDGLWALKAK